MEIPYKTKNIPHIVCIQAIRNHTTIHSRECVLERCKIMTILAGFRYNYPVSTGDCCNANIPAASIVCSPYMHISLQCRVAHRKNEVANNEATAFSIFYNNALFFFLFMLIAYFFRLLHPGMYPHC